MTAPLPGTAEWASKVSASKVAAILGLSPWESPYSMWLRMKGLLPHDDGTNAVAKARGHYLESGVIAWWKDQHPGIGENFEQINLRLGTWGAATPDLMGYDDGFGNEFVMDAKTAATDDDWGTPGTDEAPAYYVAQALWQMACWPAASVAYIAVLFGRPRLGFAEYVIQRDDDLIADVVARCREFYDSLALDTPPDLDDTVATYDAIRSLHPDIDREAAVELDRGLAHEYVTARLALDEAERASRAATTRLLAAMGRARLAKCDGATVARRQPNKSGVSLVRVAQHIDPPTSEETAA